ncbi:MAG TPA: lasso peptide biosynthesis B2 protein [Candidatus Obscuribacterales bacterium]
MRRLRKFLSLTASDRQLVVSAALLLAGIRLGLWLLPFKTLRHLLTLIAQAPLELQPTNQVSVDKVVWAVAVVSRYMPGEVKCLARALATEVLLGRSGHQAELRIGVAKGEQGQLEAHAWVESQGRIVIGALKDLARYTPLPTLEVKRS